MCDGISPKTGRRIMQDGAKLLVVDDDRMMLEFLARAVKSLGYACATASDSVSALRQLREERHIQALVIDIHLGRGRTGAQLARDAFALWPDLGVIFISGDPRALKVAQQEMPQDVEILQKPYRLRDLAAKLSRLL